MSIILTTELVPLLLACSALFAAEVTKDLSRLCEAPPAITTLGQEHCVTGKLTCLHSHLVSTDINNVDVTAYSTILFPICCEEWTWPDHVPIILPAFTALSRHANKLRI